MSERNVEISKNSFWLGENDVFKVVTRTLFGQLFFRTYLTLVLIAISGIGFSNLANAIQGGCEQDCLDDRNAAIAQAVADFNTEGQQCADDAQECVDGAIEMGAAMFLACNGNIICESLAIEAGIVAIGVCLFIQAGCTADAARRYQAAAAVIEFNYLACLLQCLIG